MPFLFDNQMESIGYEIHSKPSMFKDLDYCKSVRDKRNIESFRETCTYYFKNRYNFIEFLYSLSSTISFIKLINNTNFLPVDLYDPDDDVNYEKNWKIIYNTLLSDDDLILKFLDKIQFTFHDIIETKFEDLLS